jgi:hypothetical protein
MEGQPGTKRSHQRHNTELAQRSYNMERPEVSLNWANHPQFHRLNL